MTTKLFSSVAALGLLLAACGDDKNTSDTVETTPQTTTTNDGTDTGNTTVVDTPTTTGTSSDDTTGVVDPSTSTGPVDPSTTTTGPDPTTTTLPGTDTSDTGETTASDPIKECKMQADPPSDCSDCMCENCLQELQACEADAGCVAIRQCAEETGCTGVGCLDACGDVIDMYGGFLGKSAMIGLAVNECLGDNCSAPCS